MFDSSASAIYTDRRTLVLVEGEKEQKEIAWHGNFGLSKRFFVASRSVVLSLSAPHQ
jgi:hypothetical protein